MAKINIPERFRPGVSAIRRLDDATIRAIRAQLDSKDESGDLNKAEKGDTIVVAPVSPTSNARAEDVQSVLQAVTAMYGVRSSREMSIEEFAQEISNALEVIPEEDLRLPESEHVQFKQKLVTLLGAEFFTVLSKIQDLKIEHERTFCHARIVTDLRPVFGSNVADGPQAILVMHNLRLAYHEGDRDAKDFYVTLDADDLRSLRSLIDRAEEKAKALGAMNKKLSFPLLGASKE